MSDTNKIVAAILAASYTAKDSANVDPTDYVRAYQEMLAELESVDKSTKSNLAAAAESKAQLKRSKRV
jgi:IS1 family transposase